MFVIVRPRAHVVFLVFLAFFVIHILFHVIHGELKKKVNRPEFASKWSKFANNLTDKSDNIFWFMQITDIHISKFGHDDRISQLRDFLKSHVRIIRPDIVLATGDLTDAKFGSIPSSMQHQEEWVSYRSALDEVGVNNFTTWLDIRGNHDTFDVVQSRNSGDYFSKFGVRGNGSKAVMKYDLHKTFGRYSFVSLDFCPDPGVNFPLNFFGLIPKNTVHLLNKMGNEVDGSNHSFWFGHYPTSIIVTNGFDLRSLIGKYGFAYLCGHLHTLFGVVPAMYALQSQDFWEWELGDWRNNRYFRIIAVDNDLVSFVDMQKSMKHNPSSEWPIILVTNPKNAQFLLPSKEPTHRIRHSSHIRVLVWSNYSIKDVSVTIDGVYQGKATPAVGTDGRISNGPLYVLPWNTTQWTTGFVSHHQKMHTLMITAEDTFGNQRTVTQPFSFENRVLSADSLKSKIALLADHSLNLRIIYYTLWSLLVLLLVVPVIIPSGFCSTYFMSNKLGIGLHRIATSKICFYSLVGYMFYDVSCPIFMGYIVSDNFGIVFSYGIYVSHTFLSESLTYFYEIFQLIYFYILIMIVAIQYGRRPFILTSQSNQIHSYMEVDIAQLNRRPPNLLITTILLSILQGTFALLTVWIPYGLVATVLSPGRLLPVIITWLIYFNLPLTKLTKPSVD